MLLPCKYLPFGPLADGPQVTPDSQPFKYGEPRAATMGTCPRDVPWKMQGLESDL